MINGVCLNIFHTLDFTVIKHIDDDVRTFIFCKVYIHILLQIGHVRLIDICNFVRCVFDVSTFFHTFYIVVTI